MCYVLCVMCYVLCVMCYVLPSLNKGVITFPFPSLIEIGLKRTLFLATCHLWDAPESMYIKTVRLFMSPKMADLYHCF